MILRPGNRIRRGASLTPMVDVVFLLLFFFMLASRFGSDDGLGLALAGKGDGWTGPPRLVEIGPGTVRLNGLETGLAGLPRALDGLVETRGDTVVLAARPGSDTGDLVAVVELLSKAGFSGLVIAE